MLCYFQNEFMKKLPSVFGDLLPLLIAHSEVASCCVVSFPMEDPCGREQREALRQQPVRSWDNQINKPRGTESREQPTSWMNFEAEPPSPCPQLSLQMRLQPQLTPRLQPWRDFEAEVFSRAAPWFLIYRNCEIINICAFKPVSFGVICYKYVLVRVLQKSRTNSLCVHVCVCNVYTERKRDRENWLVQRADWPDGSSKKSSRCSLESKSSLAGSMLRVGWLAEFHPL